MIGKWFRMFRPDEKLADYVPWLFGFPAPLPEGVKATGTLEERVDVIATASGGMLMAARVTFPDLDSSSEGTLINHHDALVDLLGRLSDGWSCTLDQWRLLNPDYLPASDFGGDHAARLVDASRRRHFEGRAGRTFANEGFVTLHYAAGTRDSVVRFLMGGDMERADAVVHEYRDKALSFFDHLAGTAPRVDVLRGDQLASYLQASVGYRPQPVRMPGLFLRDRFASAVWSTDDGMRIDDREMATVEIHNFTPSGPLSFEDLYETEFESRWTTTIHALDRETQHKEINAARRGWSIRQKPFKELIAELFHKNPFASRTNPEVDRQIAELDELQAGIGDAPITMAHANVHVWGDTRREATERARRVASLVNGQGLLAKPATLNSFHALVADMPGNVGREFKNVRRTGVQMGGATRAAPVTGVSEGHREDWRFKGPALFVADTARHVPFFFALNAPGTDMAHTAWLGETGAGKSAALSFAAAQFRRYEGATVTFFDRKRSFKVACLCMGGDWLELGGGGIGVQPLRHCHVPEMRAWAQEWVVRALEANGLAARPHTNGSVARAIGQVALMNPDDRTLTALNSQLAGDDEARKALAYYLDGPQGPYGSLFDGVVPGYSDNPILGIETDDVGQLEKAAPLVFDAVFRAIRFERLKGPAPKLLVVDEAWSFFGDRQTRSNFNSYVREARKQMTAVMLATQSLRDFRDGDAFVMLEQMGNTVYLPDPDAQKEAAAEVYRRAGLIDKQIAQLARGRRKSDYLFQTGDVTRMATLRLEDDALAICGSGTPNDHDRADALITEGHAPGEAFTRAWLAEPTAAWVRRRREEDEERRAGALAEAAE